MDYTKYVPKYPNPCNGKKYNKAAVMAAIKNFEIVE